MNRILAFLRDLKMEYSGFSAKWKATIAGFLLLFVVCVSLFFSGCSYGASQEFVNKMYARSEKHFPKYIFLLDNVDNETFEKMEKLEPGTAKKYPEDFAEVKESLKRAVEAWKYEIDENNKLLEVK